MNRLHFLSTHCHILVGRFPNVCSPRLCSIAPHITEMDIVTGAAACLLPLHTEIRVADHFTRIVTEEVMF